MADTILIHPENRLLGSSGGDFGFAAAPFSFADYRPAVTFGGAHPAPAGPEPAAVVAALPEPDGGTGAGVDLGGEANGAGTAFRPAPGGEPAQTGATVAPDPLSLGQMQQSALTPISLIPPVDQPGADRATVSPATTPAADAVPVQAAPAQPAAATQPDSSLQEAAGAASALPSSALPISPAPADAAQNIVSALPEALDSVPNLNFLPTLAAPSLVLPTLPALPVLPAIELPLVDDVAGLVEASTGPLSGIVDGIEADVTDLLGADPAGGVTTLVSLVSVTDIFDLRQIDAPAPPVAEEPVISLLDALGAEPPAAIDPGDDGDASDALPIPLPIPVPVPWPPIIDPDPIGGLL